VRLAKFLVQLAAILRTARARNPRIAVTPLRGAKPAAVLALAELFAAGCEQRGFDDDHDEAPSAAQAAAMERDFDEAALDICNLVATHAASKLADFSDKQVVRLTVAVARMMAPRPGCEAPAEGRAVGDFYARALGSLQKRVWEMPPESLVDVAAAFSETAHAAVRAPSLFDAVERAATIERVAKLDAFHLKDLFKLSRAFLAARVSPAQRLAQAALREAASRGDAAFEASDLYDLARVLDDAHCSEATRHVGRDAGLYELMQRRSAVCATDLKVGQVERIVACLAAAGLEPPNELVPSLDVRTSDPPPELVAVEAPSLQTLDAAS
jgi:hypothetical protein